jgi:hypothetical protein
MSNRPKRVTLEYEAKFIEGIVNQFRNTGSTKEEMLEEIERILRADDAGAIGWQRHWLNMRWFEM